MKRNSHKDNRSNLRLKKIRNHWKMKGLSKMKISLRKIQRSSRKKISSQLVKIPST